MIYLSAPSSEIKCPATTPIPDAITKAVAEAKKMIHLETCSVAENPIVASWVLSPISASSTIKKIFQNISIQFYTIGNYIQTSKQFFILNETEFFIWSKKDFYFSPILKRLLIDMKFLVQRVRYGSVKVEKENYFQSINRGFVVLVGFKQEDGLEELEFLCNKLLNLRIFEDQNQKLNLSIKDIGGEILIISQFTLYANTSKGNRPGFDLAMKPEQAKSLYEKVVEKLKASWDPLKVRSGIFGAEMLVEIHNDGPVTILLEK